MNTISAALPDTTIEPNPTKTLVYDQNTAAQATTTMQAALLQLAADEKADAAASTIATDQTAVTNDTASSDLADAAVKAADRAVDLTA